MRASDINEEMKVAAAEALAALVGDQLSEDSVQKRGNRGGRDV